MVTRQQLETHIEKDKSKLMWSGIKKPLLGALGALLAIAGAVFIISGLTDDSDDSIYGDDTGYDGGGKNYGSGCMTGHVSCGSRCCLKGWGCCGDGRCSPWC